MVAASPSHNFEQLAKASISSDSPPHITIDSESMQVDSTKVTVNKSEDPFKDFGLAIVGKFVNYNFSTDEDKEEEQKQKEVEKVFAEKTIGVVRDTVEVATTSVPLAGISMTPSTPPT